MKKTMIILLSLMLLFTLAACSGDGGKTPSESSAPSESSGTPFSEAKKEETKVYGIGEAAETNGLSITIDKAEAVGSDIMLEKAREGFAYIKVYFTFKNVSNETIETPDRKDLYIVYEEGPTGDDCDMTSDDNSQVMLEVEDRDERYMSSFELAPGESTGGWMVYQRQADKEDITMHYYSGFINVPPDIVFMFDAEEAGGNTPLDQTVADQTETEQTIDDLVADQTEIEQTIDYSGLNLNQIAGVYNVAKSGTEGYSQIEILDAGDTLVLRFADRTEVEYEYDPAFGVASRFAEFEDGHTVLTIMTFTREADIIRVTVDESITYTDQPPKKGSYEGYMI